MASTGRSPRVGRFLGVPLTVEASTLAPTRGRPARRCRHLAENRRRRPAATSSLVRPVLTLRGSSSASHPGLGVLVAPMDQQPLRPAAVRTRPVAPEAGRPDENERAVQLLPVQLELELPVVDGTGRVGGVRVGTIGSPVPDDDVARAVLTPRDDALEVEVVERMVLDVDREPPLARVEGRPARDRPGRQHALHFEPKIVMEGGGAMTLDDEPPRPRVCADRAVRGGVAGRLRRDAEVAFRSIGPEADRRISGCAFRPGLAGLRCHGSRHATPCRCRPSPRRAP